MINLFNIQISKWAVFLLPGDIAAFCLAVPFGMLVTGRFQEDPWFFLEVYKFPILLVGMTYVVVMYVANLYDHYQDFRRHENISRVILSCLIGTVVAVLLFCFPSWRIIPRNFVEWHAVVFVWLTTLWRFSFSATALSVRLQRQVLIIGAGRAGPLKPKYFDGKKDKDHRMLDDYPRIKVRLKYLIMRATGYRVRWGLAPQK